MKVFDEFSDPCIFSVGELYGLSEEIVLGYEHRNLVAEPFSELVYLGGPDLGQISCSDHWVLVQEGLKLLEGLLFPFGDLSRGRSFMPPGLWVS